MSEIVWGDPIEVNGKRPEWLGVEIFSVKNAIGWHDDFEPCDPDNCAWIFFGGRVNITHIRLPADHPHYAKPSIQQGLQNAWCGKCGMGRPNGCALPDCGRKTEAKPDDWKNEGFTTESGSDDWQPCERTVRVCIEALPNMGTGKHLYSLRALEALIPNPDPAEMLVEEYKDTRHGFPVIHNHDVWSEIERFARHLINTGRIRP